MGNQDNFGKDALLKTMVKHVWVSFVVLTLLAILFPSANSQVYRFARRDVFKNPVYMSYTACGVKTCEKYQAKCLDDDNCCLCQCKSRFSTYNASEMSCVSDETMLSASRFRLIRNGKRTTIPILQLTAPKTLGEIMKINGNSTLAKCKVVKSYYWSDSTSGNRMLPLQMPEESLFRIQSKKNNALTLKWVYKNSNRNSWFHGRVFDLRIQCEGITSSIIFKSRKNYNENGFMGCLKPNYEKNSSKPTFPCNTMTANFCKDFCLQQGHSVALLKKGSQCICSEKSKVKTWEKNRLSCSIPCAGNTETFCGGKEAVSAYKIIPEWPHDFQFSSNGTLNSAEYQCSAITQPNPSTTWNRTYLCNKKDGKNIKLSWFSKKPRPRKVAKQQCIEIKSTTSNSSFQWNDNYLCVLNKVGLRFSWSSGRNEGQECLKINAELGLVDDYLCATRQSQITIPEFCPIIPTKGAPSPTPTHQTHKDTPKSKESTSITNENSLTSFSPTYRTHEDLKISPSTAVHVHATNSIHSSLPTHQTDKNFKVSHSRVVEVSSTNSGSESGSETPDEEHKPKDLTPLYIFVALASILSILAFGVIIILHLRKKIKAKRLSNLPVQAKYWDNQAWEPGMRVSLERLAGQTDVMTNSRRNTRVDRLPSLPLVANPPKATLNAPPKSPNILISTTPDLLQPSVPNTPQKSPTVPPETLNTLFEPQNTSQAPTLAAIAKEQKNENDVYAEISTISSVTEDDSKVQENAENMEKAEITETAMENPTYESIDKLATTECFANTECLYLEVLP